MKLVINIGLFLIAGMLVAFLFPFALVFSFIRGIYKRKPKDWYKSTSLYFFTMAFALDKFGNVLIAPMFNTIMIKSSPQFLLFGDPEETISSCLGRNDMYDNLSWLGTLIKDILNFIDPDHCQKAANKFMSKRNF
jgi:hypothetical protein